MSAATRQPVRPLVIACGAIAHELVAVLGKSALDRAVDIRCLPAEWHNTPDRIAPAVQEILRSAEATSRPCFVAYGDCGTGGQLDRVLAAFDAQRLPGPHCYAFFAGLYRFDALADQELGTLWLTDYFALNFHRLIMEGLGIARHPELRDTYFAHYRRVVWLVQEHTHKTQRAAEQAARSLDLPLVIEEQCFESFSEALTSRIIPLTVDVQPQA